MCGRIVIVMVVGIVTHEWLIDKARGWLSGKYKGLFGKKKSALSAAAHLPKKKTGTNLVRRRNFAVR